MTGRRARRCAYRPTAATRWWCGSPAPSSFGDTVRFTVDYHAPIVQGRGLYFFQAEPGRPHRPQQVYSGGGTDGNPRWLPTWPRRTTRRHGS